MRRRSRTIGFLLGLVCLTACASARPVARAAPKVSAPSWGDFVGDFVERYFARHPAFAVAMGRHEFDGQLSDFSPRAFETEIAWLESVRDKIAAFSDAALEPEARFQRAYLKSRIEAELFWLRDMREPFRNPAFYIDGGLDPSTYVTVPYAPPDRRLRAFVKYANAIPAALDEIRKNLQQPMPKTFVDYAVAGFHGFAEFYRHDVPLAFAAVNDAGLQAELQRALELAAQAMSALGDELAAQTEFDENGYVLGKERFTAMLAVTEGVTTPLERVAELGRADLERNQRALESACAAYLPKGSIRACIEKEQADKPTGGVVEAAREQLAMLRGFVAEHELVSIPGSEEAKVELAPAYRRQNFAYIEIPGPYESNLPSVYYIAPPDPAWPRAEQEAYVPGKADLLFTSVHEVWPGHFLQSLHSKRSAWRFGRLFTSYAFDEGWAHYAEELMIEAGLAKDAPGVWVGELLNALLRNVRFECAIGLHTEGMSVAACEQLFKDEAFQDPGNARQQAARGTYDPGYLNYTLGKLMIRKLRSDWEAEHPRQPELAFHDALLAHGGPPLPLLRPLLLAHPEGELF